MENPISDEDYQKIKSHRDVIAKHCRTHYEKNGEVIRKRRQDYYEANKERLRAEARERYRLNNIHRGKPGRPRKDQPNTAD